MKTISQIMETATGHHRAGRLVEAEHHYNEILQIDRNHVTTLGLLGALNIQIGKYDHAEEMLRKALLTEPLNPDLLNNLGCALLEQDNALAAMTAFEKALHVRGHFPHAHYNIGNAFHKLDNVNNALAHYEEALRQQPQYFDALVQLCNVLREQGQLEKAIAYCETALRREPGNFLILNKLGILLRELGKPELAVAQYDRALRLKSDFADALLNRGTALRDIGKITEAKSCYEQAIRVNPNMSDAYVALGVVLTCDFGLIDEALENFDHALRLQPNSYSAQWNKALALLSLGKYDAGWKLYECGLGHKDKRGKLLFDSQRWDGVSVDRLLLWHEQGFGDSLQFIRYAALCKQRAKEVIVRCPKALIRLFQATPYIDEVCERLGETKFDAHASLMSLPYIFGTNLKTIPATVPYLSVSEDAEEKWSPHFRSTDSLKIGLVWAGDSRETNVEANSTDKRRSVHLYTLLPLLTFDAVQFYSLQLGKPAAQIKELDLQGRIIDLTDGIADFMDTAAIIQNLDLIISVDTAVAHLAGALAKPVWILSRFDACWRWLQNQPTSPWYPTVRIFGQPSPGDWQSVIENVQVALSTLVNER